MRVVAMLALPLVFAALPAFAQSTLPPAATSKVDYDKDVRPILSQNCYSCHGDTAQQSGLRLDLRQNALRGGDYGPVILPGKSADSKLIKRLVDGDGGMQMPPTGALTAEEIGILRAWIDQGAEFRTTIVERPPKPTDPKLAAAIAVVRSQQRSAVEPLVKANPDLVKQSDAGGSTLLHHAAGFGTVDTMAYLIDAGSNVNATNRRRSTPLHWAVHDEAKVRLLVSRGANVNARQVEGITPVYLAATLGRGVPVLKFLLEQGGDPAIAMSNGQTPLMAAAVRGRVDALQLLLERKTDVNARNGAGETALMFAATNGNPAAVKLLLDVGADATTRTKRNETALGNASTAGVEETVKLLLERGADVNARNFRGFSPLMFAASSDAMPAGVVKLLLAKGADTTFTADYDETAHDLAAKRGSTDVTRLLRDAPRKPSPVATHEATAPVTVPTIAHAVEKAMVLLEKQSYNFIRTGGCNSCHSQDLPSAAAAFARSRGLKAPREIAQLPEAMTQPAERVMDLNVVSVTGLSWELFDSALNNVPANAFTDAVARIITASQTSDGHWSTNESRRPPMNTGDFQATALAIHALRRYTPALAATTTTAAIDRAVRWLEAQNPQMTQDRAFHALGLAWANATATATASARALLASQRADGGWSQMPAMESDAYATGQALYALRVAGKMTVHDPAYRKGIDFLLRTQAADGTWHVKSRSIWLQPYFESGFPYGQDQFISTAGTAWAALALTAAVEASVNTLQN